MEYPSVLRENRQRSKMQVSPLMFESDEEDTEAVGDSANSSNKENAEESVDTITEPSKEERILKGFQTVLMGIPPPPAFTVPQLDCREILKLWRENQSFRISLSPGKGKNNRDVSKELEKEAKNTKWPDTLQLDYWDVYYNKSSASEELERLSIRYKDRYVGAETSSCINALFAKSPKSTASARKRARHRAWGHSPGRRLSHLARRRKAFSSASLCSVAGNNNPDKKMIMVEIKKIGNRQKKKGSAKKTKPTPKKKKETQSSTFKRALFQSPDQDPMNAASKTPSTQCIQRSKRNLFADSSEKKNEFGKRERPVPKRVSPRKRVNRSLSFQESLQTSTPPCPAPAPASRLPKMQPQPLQALSGAHKQKLLWAATNALREEGMGMSHELFRPCMTVLFRTCQRLWLTKIGVGLQDAEGSTSERMLALAKQFSSYTIREISSDPTSEHMALVYNNSLKMAENMFNQPCSSRTSSTVTCDSGVKNDNNVPVFDNSCKVNRNVSMKTIHPVGSSVVKKVENITEKTRTPGRSKNTSGSEKGQVSNIESRNTRVNPMKHTPSKVSLNIIDSPRSSPRLAKKTGSDFKIKSSVCNALFSKEAIEKTSESCDREVHSGLNEQTLERVSTIAYNESKNENSASSHSGNLKVDPLSKKSNISQRQSPLKSSVNIRESPKRTCTSKKLCEFNVSSLVVDRINSLCRNDCDSKYSNSKNDHVDVVQPKCNPNVDDKILCGISSKFLGDDDVCFRTLESNPQRKLTPAKKVSFNTISPSRSCHAMPSCSVEVKNIFSSPGKHCNRNELPDPLCTNSILKKTASSDNFCVSESFGGRRVTRSVSTDTKVKNNKPIHYLFSPPTTQRNKVLSTKVSSKEVSKQFGSYGRSNSSEAQATSQWISEGAHLPGEGRRVTRRASNDIKTQNSLGTEPPNNKNYVEYGNNISSNPESDPVKQKDLVNLALKNTPSKQCLSSSKSPKKKTATRRRSWGEKSTSSVNSAVSLSSNQNNTVENNDALTSSPEFVSPLTRLKKAKLNKKSNVSILVSTSKTTPDKLASLPEFVSPGIQLRKATLNKRASVASSSASSSKETPDKSVFSEEYSADTENSSATLICESEKSLSQRTSDSGEEKSDGDYETNKENLGEERQVSGYSDKHTEISRHHTHRHLSSVENTPTNQVVTEEPVSRTLQLYRLSSSGGDNMETDKLLPEIVCVEPPKLMPHWAEDEHEPEENPGPQKSPPPLTPHWEQESCSGTSTSLPESIMAHWQQLSAKANENSSDKVMFDFEDTSYEITFPSANEDSRASSICAPFDFPLLIDDSKSGFNNVFRRSSTESSD